MQNQHSRSYAQRIVAALLTAIAGLSLVGAAAPTASAAFKFVKVVDTDTPIPGSGGTARFQFNPSDIPAVSGLNVVFGTANQDVWTARTDGTNKKKVIKDGQRIPNGLGEFHQFYGNFASIYKDTVVLVGTNCSGCNSGVGLYAVPVSGGPVTALVDTKTFLPGSDTDKFQAFPPDFDVNGNHVVFTNRQKVWAVPLGGGAVTSVATLTGTPPPPSPPAPYCCLFDQPTLKGKTVLLRAGNVFGRGSIQTVNRGGAPGSFRLIAGGDTHAPGTPDRFSFDDFEFALPVIDGQTFVFRGGSHAPDKPPTIFGIYSFGEQTAKLVDTRTRVPGGVGTFQWPGSFDQIAASGGLVVFRGRDADGKIGLYVVRQEGGRIRKIIAEGDPINGFTVAPNGVAIGKNSLSGNTVVFLVGYANFQGAGIYSTTIELP